VLGYEIIFVLGQIGDLAALPALLHIRDKDRNDVILPGPFHVVLNQAIVCYLRNLVRFLRVNW
jgi:hypothetical protein